MTTSLGTPITKQCHKSRTSCEKSTKRIKSYKNIAFATRAKINNLHKTMNKKPSHKLAHVS